MKQYDVFLCHASEDKEAVVRPLVSALGEAGISHWVDELQVKWGDSIGAKINEGLRNSKYVIVVVSDAFVSKQWPQTELHAAFNREMSDGATHVLPLFVGNRNQLSRAIPLLADKHGLDWLGDANRVIRELQAILGMQESPPASSLRLTPKIPSVPKPITDLDRDRFLKSAYQAIFEYFQAGVAAVAESGDHIHAELDEQTSSSFTCQIYLNGNKQNFSQIWIGNDLGSFGCIYYSNSPQAFHGGSMAFNEIISIDEASGELKLKETMGNNFDNRAGIMTPQQAAERLWQRFIE